MLSWLHTLLTKSPQPLKGAPKVRREKTYSAETGYVYQYFYLGYRETRRGERGFEHQFEVASDRSSHFTIRVFLGANATGPWEKANGRQLGPTEQYALVKLSLFRAFDERKDFSGDNALVIVTPNQVEEHIATLDL